MCKTENHNEKKNDTSNASVKLKKLSPCCDIDLKNYESHLNDVFNDDDINIIALSGSYGSGKSSVLLTYEKKYISKKFIHISLSHFSYAEENKNKEEIEDLLERKIVNQLLHQIAPANIPQSGFKIKQFLHHNEYTKNILLLIFSILLMSFAFFPKYILDIFRSGYTNINDWLNNSIVSLLRFSSFIGSIFLGYYLIYKLVCFITIKHPVKGISVNGNQLIVDNDKLPFFDKYLDEILYLFDNCNADAIVFEDIDRFDSVKIFERIKEIIYLANTKRINAGANKLKFFFLLRDDIFNNAKERTKFFDVIIPIIPVVDSSNSYDKILERLESFPYDKKINNDFLKGLSVYIDDMRMLTNIVNEFIIYNEQLADINLDLNKLFAIVTYKNLFPDDFIKLQYHSGFVYTCFKYKNDFSGKLLGKIDSRINEIQKNIALFEYSSDTENQLPGNENEAPISDEVLKIKQNLYHDINELDNQKNNIISSDSLSSLLQCIDNSNLFFDEVSTIYSGTKAIKRNEYFDLLVFLLVNGYLDENYPDYITYFYGKALSKNDKNYICNIFEGRNVKYQYKLDNIQNVIDKLPTSLFLKKGIFNFDIFDLLLTDRRYEEKKNSLMCVLLLDKDGSSFLSAFLNEGRNFKECIMEINGKDPSYFSKTVLIYHDLFSNEIKHKYVVYSLSFCSKKTLQEMNEKIPWLNIYAQRMIFSYTTGMILMKEM